MNYLDRWKKQAYDKNSREGPLWSPATKIAQNPPAEVQVSF